MEQYLIPVIAGLVLLIVIGFIISDRKKSKERNKRYNSMRTESIGTPRNIRDDANRVNRLNRGYDKHGEPIMDDAVLAAAIVLDADGQFEQQREISLVDNISYAETTNVDSVKPTFAPVSEPAPTPAPSYESTPTPTPSYGGFGSDFSSSSSSSSDSGGFGGGFD